MSTILMSRQQRGSHDDGATAELPYAPRAGNLAWPWGCRVKDAEFAAMVRAYHRNGGVADAEYITQLLRKRTLQPISTLARWIVARHVVSFVWRSQTLLPLFQFDLSDMSLNASASAAAHELSGAYDDWGVASWFARPNPGLQDRTPVDLIAVDPAAVLDAAREDRFVARG
jgi:hypothetical protein